MKKILWGLGLIVLIFGSASYAQSKRVVLSGIGSYDDPSKEARSVVYSLDKSLRADPSLAYGTGFYLHSIFDNTNPHKGDGSRAIDVNFEWRTFNHTDSLREILAIISDEIAIIIAKNEYVSKATISWEVSFLKKNSKSAWFNYTFENKKIQEKTKKFAPILLQD